MPPLSTPAPVLNVAFQGVSDPKPAATVGFGGAATSGPRVSAVCCPPSLYVRLRAVEEQLLGSVASFTPLSSSILEGSTTMQSMQSPKDLNASYDSVMSAPDPDSVLTIDECLAVLRSIETRVVHAAWYTEAPIVVGFENGCLQLWASPSEDYEVGTLP